MFQDCSSELKHLQIENVSLGQKSPKADLSKEYLQLMADNFICKSSGFSIE